MSAQVALEIKHFLNGSPTSVPSRLPTQAEPRPPMLGLGGELPAVLLSGVRLHAITERQCIEWIISELRRGRGGWVATPNLDHVRRVRMDPRLVDIYSDASLRVADGMPLVWASRLQGTPLPERVAGSSLVCTLSEAAAQNGYSIYLLGGEPGAAIDAARSLRQNYPALKVAGTACPPIGFERDPRECTAVVRSLKAARPDIVYVALGSPKQERLIAQLRLELPQSWWLGVGISLSFLAGRIPRAPLWMQRAGLEWLHRLAHEPGRLARRYLMEGVPFAMMLLGEAVMRGLAEHRTRRNGNGRTVHVDGRACARWTRV